MRRELARELHKDGIEWNKDSDTIHCMAHVIQLAVNQFLRHLKSTACNDIIDHNLSEARLAEIDTKNVTVSNTFAKVSCLFPV